MTLKRTTVKGLGYVQGSVKLVESQSKGPAQGTQVVAALSNGVLMLHSSYHEGLEILEPADGD